MRSDLRERLLRHLKCQFKTHEPLAPHTTFKIGGPAAIFAEPATLQEFVDLFRLIREERASYFYLGHGSNILVADEGFDGVVICAHGELCRIGKSGDQVYAGPGAKLLALTCFAAANELSGMEPLCGIPGSVGGGLWMNAGAYGGEISDTLTEVDVLTGDVQLATLARDDIGFSYRNATALRDVLVLESRYRLKSGVRMSIYREMRRVWKLRREKQPLEYPSAGSIFKRPPGDYAGRLIEAVNGKGLRIGDAMVSHKHAGIFVNFGNCTARDMTALIREIRRRVYAKFNILLENEVRPIGFSDDPFAIET
jgi:UDP-N-acetylmuramate dehydrogenase